MVDSPHLAQMNSLKYPRKQNTEDIYAKTNTIDRINNINQTNTIQNFKMKNRNRNLFILFLLFSKTFYTVH